MKDCFKNFLKLKGIQISIQQQNFADLLFDEIDKNAEMCAFMCTRRTGKTVMFNLLDDFFSSSEIFDGQNFIG